MTFKFEVLAYLGFYGKYYLPYHIYLFNWQEMMVLLILQVLEKDLAIFGFFIALGRSTKSFLASNGFSVVDDHIESFVRCAYAPIFVLSLLGLVAVKMCVFSGTL